jgi:hypothetical protein
VLRRVAVAGLAHLFGAVVGAGTAPAVEVAAVAPFAGAQPVAVLGAAGAVGAVDAVAGAESLVACSIRAVFSAESVSCFLSGGPNGTVLSLAAGEGLGVAALGVGAYAGRILVWRPAETVKRPQGLNDCLFPG